MTVSAPVLTRQALNRATLERQCLLARTRGTVVDLLERLVGMQAQTPHTAYVGVWSRLAGFRGEDLSDRIEGRAVVRIALMRSTIHMVTARDAAAIRPLVQPVLDRTQRGQFGRRLEGIDTDEVVACGRAFVDIEPRTFKALGDHLLDRWPARDRLALEQQVRTGVPLVQVPPRGLWRRSGPIAHTSLEAWVGSRPEPDLTLEGLVLRYLGAFGPASVMDIQAWCGLTRLHDVVEGARHRLIAFRDESGRELFDLPDAPRPDPDTPAPVRFLYDYDNILLSHADRSRMISIDDARRLVPDTQESNSTYLVDGFVAGTWKVFQERASATLVLQPIRTHSTLDLEALNDEGAALLGFVASTTPDLDIRVEPARLSG